MPFHRPHDTERRPVPGRWAVVAASAALCIAVAGAAEPDGPGDGSDATLRVVMRSEAPVIDGRLDDPVWAEATVVEGLHQVSPDEYAPPSEQTRIYIYYDSENLYVGARLYDDEPNQISARVLRQGERVNSDAFFAVILDPFFDHRNGYRFDVNPNGVRDDAIYQNTSRQLREWEGIWRAAAQIDDQGWTAEMAIPFKTLSFDPNGERWGINFMRFIPRHGEYDAWVSRNRSVNPSITGTAIGFSDLDQGLGLDIVPAASMHKTKSYVGSGESSKTEPSLDLFYKFTPALSGSLTLNTDFSATEVDDRQVDLSRFSLFFPEKRAFFLKDSDIFEFGGLGLLGGFGSKPTYSRPSLENGRPFFSRSIGLGQSGEPVGLDYGGKLSGRIGRWNIGTLAIRQEQTPTTDASDILVARATANVLAESTLGAIVTSGDPRSDLGNSVAGLDFRYQNSRLAGGRQLIGDAWYQRSHTEGLSGNDAAFGFRLQSPNQAGFRGGVGIKELQENFNPALGFVNRRGIRDNTLDVGYTFRPRDAAVRSIFTGVDFQRIDLLSGGVQSEILTLRPLEIENRTRDTLNVKYLSSKEVLVDDFAISSGVVLGPGRYEFNEIGLDLASGSQRGIAGTFSYASGDFYSGTHERIAGGLTWAPSRHFRLNATYDVNDVKLPEGDFSVRLVTLRSDIVFTARLSWVNLIQYDNVSETIGFNSRLHWIPEAGREGFIVLNHNLARNADGTFVSQQADVTVKFSYTFRF